MSHHDDTSELTPPATLLEAVRLSRAAKKHAKAADDRSLLILGKVEEVHTIARLVLVPRTPRSNLERAVSIAASIAVVVYVGWMLGQHLALAMP